MTRLSRILLCGASLGVVLGAPIPVANAEEYRYGDDLDVAKVIKIDTPTPATCQVVTSTMRYIDSKGVSRTLEYRRLADACTAYD